MKTNLLNVAALALLSAATLASVSCSPKIKGDEQVTAIATPGGAIIVDTFTTTATVTGIDAANREVTLVTPEGRKSTYKAGPEVVNFSQLEIGDKLKAVLTEEVAASIAKSGTPTETSVSAVTLAPVGAKPGGVIVQTNRTTATVTAVNPDKHKVTFQLADGSSKTVKVGKTVDLSGVQPGDSVTIQVGEGLVVTAEKQ